MSPSLPRATAFTQSSWPANGSPRRGAGDRVPDPHRRIAGAGDDDVAVSGPPDGHRVHPAVVAGQRAADRLAGDRVPDPHRLIVGAGDDDVPVPGPPDRHRTHRAVVAGQRVADGAPVTASQTRTVPSLEPETMTSRSPARPKATAITAAIVAGQRVADWAAGDRVPDPHRPIAGGRRR